MTVTNDVSEGWSYSMEHDTASIVSGRGALDLVSVTTVGTHTATVKDGAAADFEVTEIRDDAAEVPLGFTQGVSIDHDTTALTLERIINFVTAGACYWLNLPDQGSYQASFSFTGDIGDGRPPIASVIA